MTNVTQCLMSTVYTLRLGKGVPPTYIDARFSHHWHLYFDLLVRGGRGVRLSPWRGETAGHRAHPECISEACSRTVLTSPGSPISSWHHQRPTASSLESALPSGVHLRLKTALLEGRHTQTQRHTQTHTHTDTHTFSHIYCL